MVSVVSGSVNKIQALFVQRNIEAGSCNHCYSGKAICVTYSDYLFVALDIRHAVRMRHIVICGLSGTSVFFHIIS